MMLGVFLKFIAYAVQIEWHVLVIITPVLSLHIKWSVSVSAYLDGVGEAHKSHSESNFDTCGVLKAAWG